jgi:hypothetical protein
LRSLSDRPARVRIMAIFGDDRSGLTINARIAARAGEMFGLVDKVVGEVTLAVRNAPPAPRPSRSEDDLELAAFDDLIDELGQTITQSALSVWRRIRRNRSRGSWAAELPC